MGETRFERLASGWRFVSGRRGFVLACLLLVAANLRPSIASVSPVLERIQADVGLGYAAVSLLTTIPTVGMGVFAFAAPLVARRVGREDGAFWATVLIGVATLGRVWGEHVLVLFATTVGVSVGIGVTQALLPSLVNSYYPEYAGVVTGLYIATLIGGSGLASAFTAPLAAVFGSWTWALAVWGVVALGTAWLWRVATRTASVRQRSAEAAAGSLGGVPWREPWAWLLSLLLVGVVLVYFAELTWLAPFYVGLGWSAERAGYLLTASIVGQVVGALLVSAGSLRLADRRPLLVLVFAASTVGLAGATLRPLAAPWTWVVVMGFGIGGAAAVAFTLPVDYAPDPGTANRLSAMVVGVGYLGGGLGPFLVGAVREQTGSYHAAFLGLTVVSLVLLAFSLAFRPGRVVEAD